MGPFLADRDLTLWHGSALDVLRTLDARSVNCCITSPPYFGLRDYGVNGQIGLEPTPDEYVAALVAVFREVRRVLRDDGTLWLNLGDSYSRDPGKGGSGSNGKHDFIPDYGKAREIVKSKRIARGSGRWGGGNVAVPGMKEKDMVMIPARVALALQADGWYLRADIIWSKPNPMPSSVTDRPTCSHEYVFLLARASRYFFNQDAVREPFASTHPSGNGYARPEQLARGGRGQAEPWVPPAPEPSGDVLTLDGSGGEAPRGPDGRRTTTVKGAEGSIQHRDGERWPNTGRNIRTVWSIVTQPTPEAHFATFPEELVRRCLLAGCPEWVCGTCGKPRERLVAKESRPNVSDNRGKHDGTIYRTVSGGVANDVREKTSLGWSDCGHNDYHPGVVLDPFAGSGTVGLVAREHRRAAVLIELNPDYCEIAARRLQQLSFLAEPIQRP